MSSFLIFGNFQEAMVIDRIALIEARQIGMDREKFVIFSANRPN